MGGSGGQDYPVISRPGTPDQSEEYNCRSLRFETNLEPAPSAAAQEIGAVLPIVPTEVGSGITFVAVDEDAEPVGTILENIDRLTFCTGLGISFEAEVVNQFFGTHAVKVRAS